MGIHLLIPSLETGGAQKVGVSLINQWVKSNKVTLILFEDIIEYKLDDRVDVIVLNVKRSTLRFKTGVEVFSAYRKLKKYILLQDEKLQIFGILESANIVLSLLKLRFKDSIFVVGGSHTNVLRYGFYCNFFRIYRFLDRLVTVSQPMRGVFIQKGVDKEKIVFIPNPVDPEEIVRQSDLPLSDELKGILAQGRVIIGVGRLVKVKNFELLIRAFHIFLKSNRDFLLVILGEGPDRGNLEKLVASLGMDDKVFLPGHRDNPYLWMKNSDLFVLSSSYEGWPNVLLEALVLGVPIVSTDCISGPSEILKGGELGELVEVGDPSLMARAFNLAIKNRGKMMDTKNWRIEVIGARYLELVNEI